MGAGSRLCAAEERLELACDALDHEEPAAAACDTDRLAQAAEPFARAHRAERPVGAVDHRHVEAFGVVGKRPGGARRDLDQHALADGGAPERFGFARPFGYGAGAAGEAGPGGNRGEEPRPSAADVQHALAELHAGHRERQRVGTEALSEDPHGDLTPPVVMMI